MQKMGRNQILSMATESCLFKERRKVSRKLLPVIFCGTEQANKKEINPAKKEKTNVSFWDKIPRVFEAFNFDKGTGLNF